MQEDSIPHTKLVGWLYKKERGGLGERRGVSPIVKQGLAASSRRQCPSLTIDGNRPTVGPRTVPPRQKTSLRLHVEDCTAYNAIDGYYCVVDGYYFLFFA